MKKGSEEDEYTIKPQATTPALDTSSWPLLLKNYDKRESPRDPQLQHLFWLSLRVSIASCLFFFARWSKTLTHDV